MNTRRPPLRFFSPLLVALLLAQSLLSGHPHSHCQHGSAFPPTAGRCHDITAHDDSTSAPIPQPASSYSQDDCTICRWLAESAQVDQGQGEAGPVDLVAQLAVSEPTRPVVRAQNRARTRSPPALV